MEDKHVTLQLSVVSLSGRMLVESSPFAASAKISELAQVASDELGSPCLLSWGTGILMRSWTLAECKLMDGAILTACAALQLRIFASKAGIAFAAVKTDGSVITWGDSGRGGDSSSVKAELAEGVVSVTGTECAFAAVSSEAPRVGKESINRW